ncbi:nucleolar MIF4G domain-containing protein 1 [Impatiens glandulifera]|uniref:nucleolar MIF4G domain-containing protein 1 n=1 Tax=Impatiens glandulifera TaxID=253017 RepID=UPI001FB13C64|nr:nucleolar MIF4G domain-containing protein 1 [Impatiens glandulifera]
MEKKQGEKSRRELRKEARLEKNQKKHESWLEHQRPQESKKISLHSKKKNAESKEEERSHMEFTDEPNNSEIDAVVNKHEVPKPRKCISSKKFGAPKKKSKALFGEPLSMNIQVGGTITAEEDLKWEKKLAKRLKIKGGRLHGDDDGLNMLFEGMPSAFDTLENGKEYDENKSPRKKSKKNALLEKKTKIECDASTEMVSDLLQPTSHETVKIHELHKRPKRSKSELDYYDNDSPTASKKVKTKKSKSGSYQEIEMENGDDGINSLIEETPHVLEFLVAKDANGDESSHEGQVKVSSKRKNKKMSSLSDDQEIEIADSTNVVVSETTKTYVEEDTPIHVFSEARGSNGVKKYVAPHLRSCSTTESEEQAQLRRRIRGLLNRLSESNVESITSEISSLFHSVPRAIASQIIVDEVISSCSGGPRGNEQYAAVFAAFIAGMACSVGIDFGSKVLASLAKHFEVEYLEEDNLSLRNLALLLCYLYIFGVCSSDLVYDFIIMLSKRLTEIDVSTILTILECCGMNLRGDDPVEMKNFVLNVQKTANDLKASSQSDLIKMSGKRMEFMLETIYDIKNNKKRPKVDAPQHTRIKKWLQKLNVEDILLRGLKWSKLIDPDKKGQWWLSGDSASISDRVDEVAHKIDKETLEAQKMLQLASDQRMNTDIRRAIFCIIMSGEDYIDTFEKLLRLDLPGKQDREIMRVLVECCLQEKVFNKYYTILASKLCSHDRGQKVTLQNCILDHFKQLDSMQLIRSKNLSKLVAEVVASFILSLAILKRVDFTDPISLTPRRIIHFRMLFETIFDYPDSVVWNIFTRLAGSPDCEILRQGIEYFVKTYLLGHDNNISLATKFKLAKKALNNAEGVLM